jgi:hypothetical protein
MKKLFATTALALVFLSSGSHAGALDDVAALIQERREAIEAADQMYWLERDIKRAQRTADEAVIAAEAATDAANAAEEATWDD